MKDKKGEYDGLAVVGSVAYDEILVFPGKFADHIEPAKLHQINISFVVDSLDRQIGGIATNICYNGRLLDRDASVLPISAVGRDSKEFFDFFKLNGIDTRGLLIDKSLYSASGKALTDTRDNQIWGYYYGPSAKASKLDLADFATKNTCVVLSATHEQAFVHFQNKAIKMGVDYMYDIGMTLSWIDDVTMEEGVRACKWLIGNDYEIGMILRRLRMSKADLANLGVALITTLGEKGVTYESKNERYTIPAYKVSRVVDPTGAGDAFRGGFLVSLLQGSSVRESLITASALASFAVEKSGTVNHAPTQADIKKRMDSIRSIL